jgi:hypothetical protein
MSFFAEFEARLPANSRKVFRSLNSPTEIQHYLDGLPYIAEERDRSPLNVILDGQGHCLDGGFFAALALWRIGFKPLLIDLVPDPGKDDDHILALYQVEGRWGAVAKSNYVNLTFREPVYRGLRELVMTYFEHYISVNKEKTLRGYTRPFDASRYSRWNWAWDEAGANRLYKTFYHRKPVALINESMAARLQPADERYYKAATLYTNLEWSFGKRANS